MQYAQKCCQQRQRGKRFPPERDQFALLIKCHSSANSGTSSFLTSFSQKNYGKSPRNLSLASATQTGLERLKRVFGIEIERCDQCGRGGQDHREH